MALPFGNPHIMPKFTWHFWIDALIGLWSMWIPIPLFVYGLLKLRGHTWGTIFAAIMGAVLVSYAGGIVGNLLMFLLTRNAIAGAIAATAVTGGFAFLLNRLAVAKFRTPFPQQGFFLLTTATAIFFIGTLLMLRLQNGGR